MNNVLMQLLRYSQSSKKKIVFATMCSILNKICDIVPEILIGISIDVIVNQQNSIVAKLGISNPYHQLYLVGGITALLWILESVFEYLYSISWHELALTVQQGLRLKTFNHVMNLDLSYFEDKSAGGLLTVMHDDINQLEAFLAKGPNEIIQLVVNVLVMGAIFFYLSPKLALLTLLPIPFVIGIAYYYQHKLAALYEIVREASATLAGHIAYRLHGITTIKSYNTAAYELNKLRIESDRYTHANHQAIVLNAQYIPVVRMAVLFGFIVSLVMGGVYALQGIIPINWYAALVFLTQRFLWPFTSLSSITDMYERAVASAKRILAILQTKPTIVSGEIDTQISAVKGEVEFDTVSFDYANGKTLFKNFNLVIPAHTITAFVGTTGSGKSTLIKLLLRFYDAKSGSITIDKHDIKHMPLHDLRSMIALVSQEVYMVDGTVAENICYGIFNATRDEIIQAAKMAQADEFISQLPQGYDTKIEEHGKNLSGGQRQRISIARAIIKKAPILIFDEATSAIDNETEAAIQKSILQLAQNHTIIIIAHKLSTVRNADTIIVLDKGTIVEAGSHTQLLNKQGAYAQLYKSTES